MKLQIRDKVLNGGAYIYLALPIILFSAGWLRWYYSIPVVLCIICAMLLSIRNEIRDDAEIEGLSWGKIVAVLCIIIVWVYLSGIGGLSFQNSDHNARTAAYRALVEYDWPVVSHTHDAALIYYIGFWLPSALVGKLFGFMAGYRFQAIWAAVGVFLFYYQICRCRRKFQIWPIFVVVFFSGLDYLGGWIVGGRPGIMDASHLELWDGIIQYSSMSTQLFWVFNQAIPAWLATALIVRQRECKNVFFVLSLIIITSTLPFVGLIPIAVCVCFQQTLGKRIDVKSSLREICSAQNMIGVFVVGIVTVLFLFGNNAADQKSGIYLFNQLSTAVVRIGLFLFIEVGIYAILVWRKYNKSILFYVIIIELVLCPMITVGGGIDFCMRASIPPLIVLMMMCIESLSDTWKHREFRSFIPLLISICIGGICGWHEIHRSLINTVNSDLTQQPCTVAEYNIEEELLVYENFSGPVHGNRFFEYLSRLDYDSYINEMK